MDRILLAHGSGGRMSHQLLEQLFLPYFDNPILARLDDSAVFDGSGRLAFTTDSYVVSPLFFPGGDIGRLSICGTVNDLAMSGATPLHLSASFIIEEGFLISDLRRILGSMKQAAREANVTIVAGDTKVVGEAAADGIFITTSGVGSIPEGLEISGANARVGDIIMVSGPVGDHGAAILTQREGLKFSSPVVSDCAPLSGLVDKMLQASTQIRCLRDPTRGGLATTLNELASQSRVGLLIEEESIPVRQGVKAICELLGLDPLYLASEGRLVAMVAPEEANGILAAMRNHPYGAEATIIGQAVDNHPRRVVMRTSLGAHRPVEMLMGEPLPRIC